MKRKNKDTELKHLKDKNKFTLPVLQKNFSNFKEPSTCLHHIKFTATNLLQIMNNFLSFIFVRNKVFIALRRGNILNLD